tara:strand:- start:3766 stop:4437 length:672 start_codon:yes stop_codon:yes gene_type:complete
MVHKDWTLILDFDSTIIKGESLDLLAETVFENRLEPNLKLQEIKKLTDEGMEGRISFQESLNRRLKILELDQFHLNKAVTSVTKLISPSFKENIDWLKRYRDNILIFSGGFKNMIKPVAMKLGLKEENIYANELIFKNGKFNGVNKKNLLSRSEGKLNQVKQLGLNKNLIVVGDGITDWEIKKLGGQVTFFAYTENVSRKNVLDKADFEANNFNEVVKYIKGI